ncbi:MAG: hypothetical protein HGA45_01355 [Chloroflexales bacterium]|nr:hypothetical protein [Chloroflexales bacterium]
MGTYRLLSVVFQLLLRLLPRGAVALVFNLALMVVDMDQNSSCHPGILATVLTIKFQPAAR